MPSLVEIQYNPFLPRLNVLIDGKHPASYSRLIQYSDEDIWQWSDEITDAIYAEIRDYYSVIFTGTEQDAEIIEKYCEKNDKVRSFKKRNFTIPDGLQPRMGKLNQLIKKTSIANYQRTIVDVYFFVPPVYEALISDIRSIDVNNLYCSVRVQAIGLKSQYKDNDRSVLFVVAENISKGYEYLGAYITEKPAYVLVMGEKKD